MRRRLCEFKAGTKVQILGEWYRVLYRNDCRVLVRPDRIRKVRFFADDPEDVSRRKVSFEAPSEAFSVSRDTTVQEYEINAS